MALKSRRRKSCEENKEKGELTNLMKLLEKQTLLLKQELELLESLKELKDLNRWQQTIDYDQIAEVIRNRCCQTERTERVKQYRIGI